MAKLMSRKEAQELAKVIEKYDTYGWRKGRMALWRKLVRGGWLIEPPWHTGYKYKVLDIKGYAKKYGMVALPEEARKKLKRMM